MRDKMPQPQPKSELLITNDEVLVYIHVETVDAQRWREEQAPHFGMLTQGQISTYVLNIRPTFDRDEVVAWLNSYSTSGE